MTRHYLFADESGNFDFSRRVGATKYFAVGTIHVIGDDAVESLRRDLLNLQTDLAWRGLRGGGGFHASDDQQHVRDEVYALLGRHALTADITILEKSKAQPHLRASNPTFFQVAWFCHLRHLIPTRVLTDDQLMIAVAAVGTKRLRRVFQRSVERAMSRCTDNASSKIVFASAESDPALQAADYLLWAVMRAWERGDESALRLVEASIRSQIDLFASGTVHYY